MVLSNKIFSMGGMRQVLQNSQKISTIRMDKIANCKRFQEICIYKVCRKMETKMETKKYSL